MTGPGPAGTRRGVAMWLLLVAAIGAVLVLALPQPGDDGAVRSADERPAIGAAPATTVTTIAAVAGNPASREGSTDVSSPAPAAPMATTVAPTTSWRDPGEPDDTSPNTLTTVVPAGACLPGYAGACVPPAPPVLTCADLSESNILVTGWDPHGLDDDADGVACPSTLPPATAPPGAAPDPLD